MHRCYTSSAPHGGDAGMALKRQAMAIAVVRLWSLSGKLYPVPAEALSVMTRSILGLAKLCAWQVLQLLQHSQKEGPGCGAQHDQLQQQASQDAGRLTYAKLVTLGEEGISYIRSMAGSTSNFQIYNQQGSLHHKIGEQLFLRRHTKDV